MIFILQNFLSCLLPPGCCAAQKYCLLCRANRLGVEWRCVWTWVISLGLSPILPVISSFSLGQVIGNLSRSFLIRKMGLILIVPSLRVLSGDCCRIHTRCLEGHMALTPCLVPAGYCCHYYYHGHRYHHYGFLLALQVRAGSYLRHASYETPPEGLCWWPVLSPAPSFPSFPCSPLWSLPVDAGGGGTLGFISYQEPNLQWGLGGKRFISSR